MTSGICFKFIQKGKVVRGYGRTGCLKSLRLGDGYSILYMFEILLDK